METLTKLFTFFDKTEDSAAWPPNYQLRHSSRAKRISVLICPKDGLVLVVPKRKRTVPTSALNNVLNEHRKWIEKHLNLWLKEQTRKQQEPLLPNRLFFPAFQKEIKIEYHDQVSSQIRMTRKQDFLILKGPMTEQSKIITLLKKFLKYEAEQLLLPLLKKFSDDTGLIFQHGIVRTQSTLWGSCTASKKISLNTKLLFLPKSLISYVILHELCHTVELNHSKRFWSLLKKFDPDCLQHRKALRTTAQYLPAFFDE